MKNEKTSTKHKIVKKHHRSDAGKSYQLATKLHLPSKTRFVLYLVKQASRFTLKALPAFYLADNVCVLPNKAQLCVLPSKTQFCTSALTPSSLARTRDLTQETV